MENEIIAGEDDKRKGKGPPPFLHQFLSNLLIKFLKWEQLLKDSETLFAIQNETETKSSDAGCRAAKKAKLNEIDDDHVNNGSDISIVDENKTIAVLDWRSSNGALTQDEKTRLHRDLKLIMKNISGIDSMLTALMAKEKINDTTIT